MTPCPPSRSTGSYRTAICWKFMQGSCAYGENCKYIHPEDVHFPPHQRMSPFVSQTPLPQPAYLYLPPGEEWPVAPRVVDQPDGQLSHNLHQGQDLDAPALVYPLSVRQLGPIFPLPYLIPQPSPQSNCYKPISWRTTPCKHFAKNNGWCPLGDACNFIHDLTHQSVHAKEVGKIRQQLSISMPSLSPEGSTSHCWAYVQGICNADGCRFLHPRDIHPYMKYTPCLAWPNCSNSGGCAFKHPEPFHAVFPGNVPLPQVHITADPATHFSYSPQEINGTTYFPIIVPAPVPPMNHDVSILCAPVNDADDVVSVPPPLPIVEEAVCSDNTHVPDVTPVVFDVVMDRRTATADHEFPYCPPQTQRVGHARRISVALKPRTLGERSGTIGSISQVQGRMSHAGRDKRKSWAAFSAADRSQTVGLQYA